MSRSEPTAITSLEDPRFTGHAEVERVAEVHLHLRSRLERALEAVVLTEEGRQFLSTDAATYRQYWEQTYGDRYFDMGTLQRLATAVESGLRHYHRAVAGAERGHQVATTDRGIFQQLVHPAKLLKLYQDDCGYDLSSNPGWPRMRELVVHRHLYAHRSGLVDDLYINDFREVRGEDLLPQIASLGYPDEEVLWFSPLKQLGLFIEDVRLFFRHLPAH